MAKPTFFRSVRAGGEVTDVDIATKTYVDYEIRGQGRDLKEDTKCFWLIPGGKKILVTFARYDHTGLCGVIKTDGSIAWINRSALRKISWLESLALCAGDEDGTSQEEGS